MSPSIRINNQATDPNALTGLKFVKLLRPALISVWLSCVTGTDTVDFSFTDREVLRGATPNIEISADVVDSGRDQVLFAEPADPGEELFMPVTATTAVNFLILVDEL